MNRVLDCRYGRMIVNDNDVYIGRMLAEYGEFSEGEVELFRNILRKDMVALDIGANIGAHTLPMSKLADKVIAFEPQRELYHALCGMCALNDLHNVTCLNAAVGSFDGSIPIYQVDTEQTNNLGSASLLEMGDSQERIACMTIDFPFHFMKVDVEGMELEVLKGAQDRIREFHPAIYVENDREDRSDALIDFVESLGYQPYWHTPAFYNPENFRNKRDDLFHGMGSINMLCMPRAVSVGGLDVAKKGEWGKRFTIAEGWRKVA